MCWALGHILVFVIQEFNSNQKSFTQPHLKTSQFFSKSIVTLNVWSNA